MKRNQNKGMVTCLYSILGDKMKQLITLGISICGVLCVWIEHLDAVAERQRMAHEQFIENEKSAKDRKLQWEYSSELHRNAKLPPSTLPWTVK